MVNLFEKSAPVGQGIGPEREGAGAGEGGIHSLKFAKEMADIT